MKIWIDLTNSPHVNFFKPFIKKWQKERYKVIITTRNLANTIDLIEQNEWEYTEIGGHAGKNKLNKILYFPCRVIFLLLFLRKNKPDIGISQSSFYSPIVGKLIGFPTIYLNDNEYAKGNHIAFRYASLNIIPEFLKDHASLKKWNKKYKLKYYPGIKEGIYLSQLSLNKVKKNNSQDKKHIFIRLEPWTAQYYKGKNKFLDNLILQLKKNYSITILPRSVDIVKKCSLFIGAGGSMTRELAYLGVSTISVYQDDLLEVDKYLINNNYMVFLSSPTVENIENIIIRKVILVNNDLFKMGKVAFQMINNKVKEYAKN